jgi:glutaredoxin
METVVRAVMLAALLAATAAAAGTVYKSTGPDGTVVYSDHPPANGKIDKVITFDDLPSSPVPPPPVQSTASRPGTPPTHPAVAKPRPNGRVVLYMAKWCPYCRRAKAWLAQRQIPYEEIDIESEVGRAEFQVESRGGGIPYLVMGTRHVRGFKEEGYDAFFASR